MENLRPTLEQVEQALAASHGPGATNSSRNLADQLLVDIFQQGEKASLNPLYRRHIAEEKRISNLKRLKEWRSFVRRTEQNTSTMSWSAKVVNIVQITSTVKSFTIDVGKNFDFKPGQYLDIFPSSDVLAKLGPSYTALEVVTGYSMTNSPLHTKRSGCLELSIKKTAHPVTQMLHDDVKIGDKVTVAGPGGSFYYLKDDANAYEHVVLIGGGIGATPLLSMLHYVAEECNVSTTHVTYLCSVRNIDEALHVSQIEDLVKNHSNVRAIFTVTNEDNNKIELPNKDKTNGSGLIENGRITGDKIRQIVATAEKDFAENPNRKTKYFLCGPKTMVNDIKNILVNELKVSPEVVFHESWS